MSRVIVLFGGMAAGNFVLNSIGILRALLPFVVVIA